MMPLMSGRDEAADAGEGFGFYHMSTHDQKHLLSICIRVVETHRELHDDGGDDTQPLGERVLVRHEDVVVRLPRVRRPQLEHELLALQVDHKVILGDILSRQSNVKWLF